MTQQGNQRFWQIAALAALLLCAYTVFSRGGAPARADNGGAAMDGVIAMMGTNTTNDHLYLIDTRTKGILMYESRGGNNFTLMAGRSYEADFFCLDHSMNKELPFQNNGYSMTQIQTLVQQIQAASKKRQN